MALFFKKKDKKSDGALTLPPVTRTAPSAPAPVVVQPPREPPPAAAAPPERKPERSEPSTLAPGTLATLRCSLGPDATVSGRLSFTKPTRLDGTLRGEVRATDLLVIGDTGFVDGAVHAVQLVLFGRVNGDVRGAERVEVMTGATLNGNVEAQYLVVQEGGFLDGDCRIIPPARPLTHALSPVVDAPAPSPEAQSAADGAAPVAEGSAAETDPASEAAPGSDGASRLAEGEGSTEAVLDEVPEEKPGGTV